MSKDYTIEKLHKFYNVEKWKKALRIAEIRKETNCTYEQAEQIHNEEQAKKDMRALFHDLCKHGKWHKIQNGNRAGKSQDGLPPIIAY